MGELCRDIRTSLRPVVPTALRLQVLHSVHGEPLAGHFGVSKTKETLRQRFYWQGMGRDVETSVQHVCWKWGILSNCKRQNDHSVQL